MSRNDATGKRNHLYNGKKRFVFFSIVLAYVIIFATARVGPLLSSSSSSSSSNGLVLRPSTLIQEELKDVLNVSNAKITSLNNNRFQTLLKEVMKNEEQMRRYCPASGIILLTSFNRFGRASHGDQLYCRALRSAVNRNISLFITGFGSKHFDPQRLTKKFNDVTNFLQRKIDPDCIVLFTDLDVIFQKDEIAIKNEFLKSTANGENNQVLFSAECACWPNAHTFKPDFCLRKFPASPTVYRWGNSGGYIGKAKHVATVLTLLMKDEAYRKQILKDAVRENPTQSAWDDQELLNGAIALGEPRIALDYYSSIFQTIGKVYGKGYECPIHKINMQYEPASNSFYYLKKHLYWKKENATKEDQAIVSPGVLHFNGPGRGYFYIYYDRMKKDANKNFPFHAVDDQSRVFQVTYHELCENIK